jgi:hypothetical protein
MEKVLAALNYAMKKYKVSSKISGTGAANWSKTNFWPTGHHHTWSSSLPPFCEYVLFPALLPFFKCILEILFMRVFSISYYTDGITVPEIMDISSYVIEEIASTF